MKQRILQAAETALVEYGTDFTMDYLAAKLNISKRTLYENFSSKEKIISLIIEEQLLDLHLQHRELLIRNDLSVKQVLHGYFSVEPRIYTLFTLQMAEPLLRKYPNIINNLRPTLEREWSLLQKYLEEKIKSGELAERPMEDFIGIMKAVLIDSCRRYYATGDKTIFTKEMHRVLDLLLEGLLIRQSKEEK